jgi:hypothetical protein
MKDNAETLVGFLLAATATLSLLLIPIVILFKLIG